MASRRGLPSNSWTCSLTLAGIEWRNAVCLSRQKETLVLGAVSEELMKVFHHVGTLLRYVDPRSGGAASSSGIGSISFLEWCVLKKMEYNRSRPYRHGGKRC
jgi:hypothetical protein